MLSISVDHSLIWAFCSPSVGVDLIFNIDLVQINILGCSALFSCMIQYEFGAHWFTTIAGFHVAFCLCCTQTGVPGNNSWYFLSGLLLFPCLLMSSWWVWCISGAPSALDNRGRFFSLGVCCVINCKVEAMLPDWDVTL